jgi:hypothetical protein
MFLYLLALLSACSLRDSMTLDLVLPGTVQVGDTVPITLRVTNTGRKPATLYSQGRPTAFDVLVTKADGRLVRHRLNHAVISSVLQVRELAPGEVLELEDYWDQRDDRGQAVPIGEYRVTGVLPTDPPGELRSRPARLRILP